MIQRAEGNRLPEFNKVFHTAFLSGSFEHEINKSTVEWIKSNTDILGKTDHEGFPLAHWCNLEGDRWSQPATIRYSGGAWRSQSEYTASVHHWTSVKVVKCNETNKWYGSCHTTTAKDSCIVDKAVLDIGFKTRKECAKTLLLYKMFVDKAVRADRGWIKSSLIFTDDKTAIKYYKGRSLITVPLYEGEQVKIEDIKHLLFKSSTV